MDENVSNALKFWKFFSNHLGELVTILLASIGSIIQIYEHRTFDINALILSVLGLIALSQLTNEKKLVDLIKKTNTQHVSADKYLLKGLSDKYLPLLRGAQTIDLIGINLQYSMQRWDTVLMERVRSGARIRILIMDPSGEGLGVAVYRGNDEDAEMLKSQYEYSIRKLKILKRSASSPDCVTVKVLKYPPSFAMALFSDDKNNSTGFIKLYGHDGVLDGVHPFFEVYPWRESWWYEYFQHQFKVQWESGDSTILEL